MAHKANLVHFIDPNYEHVSSVDARAIATQFQAFCDTLIQNVPDAGAPADAYMFNSHAGAMLRSLDEAKDHYVKMMLAFYAKRNSGATATKRPA